MMLRGIGNIMKAITPVLLLLTACNSGPDIANPGGGEGPSTGNGNEVSIAYLKSQYRGWPMRIDRDYTIKGQVVSNDRTGNFYKTLYVSDNSGGIAVRVDIDELFKVFAFGTYVKIHCNSLWIGAYGGNIQLGTESFDGRYEVDYLYGNLIYSAISKTDVQWQEPVPIEISKISDINSALIGRLVRVSGVQFISEQKNYPWCDEGLDTDRHLIDRVGDTLLVRTSSYASFGNFMMPEGSGEITGVMGYFNGNYQMQLNSQHDAVMTGERF